MVLPEGIKKVVVYLDSSEQRMMREICEELKVKSESRCIRRIIREFYTIFSTWLNT